MDFNCTVCRLAKLGCPYFKAGVQVHDRLNEIFLSQRLTMLDCNNFLHHSNSGCLECIVHRVALVIQFSKFTSVVIGSFDRVNNIQTTSNSNSTGQLVENCWPSPEFWYIVNTLGHL